jgi:hypothetical protein
MQVPENYEDWKKCITVVCGIPLTRPYVEQRLIALRNPADYMTQNFVTIWGEPHRQRVIGWFERARREVAGTEDAVPGGRTH